MNKLKVILKILNSLLYGTLCFFLLVLIKYFLQGTIEKLNCSRSLTGFLIFGIIFFVSGFTTGFKAPSGLKYIWIVFLFQLIIGVFVFILWMSNPLAKKYFFSNIWLYYILLNLVWLPFTLLGGFLGIKVKGKIKKRQ